MLFAFCALAFVGIAHRNIWRAMSKGTVTRGRLFGINTAPVAAVAMLLCFMSGTGASSKTKIRQPASRADLSALDTAIRGNVLTPDDWAHLDNAFKFDMCLRHKVGDMRTIAGNVSRPEDLVGLFPEWQASLNDCQSLYPIDKRQGDRLREAVAIQMAKTIGEETTSFLLLQRMFQDDHQESVRDMWRSETITGINEVQRVLDTQK